MRPVATVPRPLIENTSSTAIKNGLSTSRIGSGISESSAASKLPIVSSHFASPFKAGSAAPWITLPLSPSNLYLLSSSRQRQGDPGRGAAGLERRREVGRDDRQ